MCKIQRKLFPRLYIRATDTPPVDLPPSLQYALIFCALRYPGHQLMAAFLYSNLHFIYRLATRRRQIAEIRPPRHSVKAARIRAVGTRGQPLPTPQIRLTLFESVRADYAHQITIHPLYFYTFLRPCALLSPLNRAVLSSPAS